MSTLCDVNEPEEMRVGKFIGGLREDLREKLEVTQHLTFETACSSALTYENYSKKKNTYVQTYKLEVIKHRAGPRCKNLSIDASRAGPKCGPKVLAQTRTLRAFAGLCYILFIYIM